MTPQELGAMPAHPMMTEFMDRDTRTHGSPKWIPVRSSDGMTLRQHYAGLAMQGILSSGIPGEHYQPQTNARDAVRFADALLAALAGVATGTAIAVASDTQAVFVSTSYDWSLAPEWAQWAGTDFSGERWFYADKPIADLDSRQWVFGGPGDAQRIDDPDPARCLHWCETLAERPA